MKRVVQTFHPFVLMLPSHSSTKTLLHSIPVCKYKCRTTVGPAWAPVVPAEMIYHGLKDYRYCIFGRTRFAQPIHTVTDEWKFREINHREQRHTNITQSIFKLENSLFQTLLLFGRAAGEPGLTHSPATHSSGKNSRVRLLEEIWHMVWLRRWLNPAVVGDL